MSYAKQAWDTNSYVNPTRMNHIEDGIEAASNKADDTVSKSTGGTFSGDVTIATSSGDSRIILGSSSSIGQVRFNNGNYRTSMYPQTLTTNRTVELPDKSGTVALTSDISDVGTSAKFINLYVSGTSSSIVTVVQNVLDAITTDNKICIVNAIHQYSGIRYLNGYIYADKSYGSFILQTYSSAYKCKIENGTITYSQII